MSRHEEGEFENHHEIALIVPSVGPGSDGGGGGGSDSPIIITDGSCQIISINDDFHPNTLRSNGAFTIQKSNNGTAIIRPGNTRAIQVPFTITITDAGGNTIAIVGTPSAAKVNGIAFFNWMITVTSSLASAPLTRFDMNGGESRVAHPTFVIASATVNVGAGNVNISSPGHISVSFR